MTSNLVPFNLFLLLLYSFKLIQERERYEIIINFHLKNQNFLNKK